MPERHSPGPPRGAPSEQGEPLYAALGRALAHSDLVPIAIAREGRIVFANSAFLLLFDRADWRPGRPLPALDELFPGDGDLSFSERLRSAAGASGATFLCAAHGAKGSLINTEVRGAALDADGTMLIVARRIEEDIDPGHPLVQLAYTDWLTGLANRALLQERLPATLAAAQSAGHRCAVLVADLDNFKAVNDGHGHRAGDLLLKSVAQRLIGCARDSDIVARLGGDEFVILLTSVQDAEAAAMIAARVVRAIGSPFEVDGIMHSIGASVGIALYPDDAQDADALFASADDAMYESKRSGRGRYLHAGGAVAEHHLRPFDPAALSHVGVDSVDEEHVGLMTRLNEITTEMESGCSTARMHKLLHELLDQTRMHFLTEEELMARAGDAELSDHRAEHERALEDLRALSMTADPRSVTLTARYLQEWLQGHIDTHDKPMGARLLRGR